MKVAVGDEVFVMPGLVPGIHVSSHAALKVVDGRDKPGHDDMEGERFLQSERAVSTLAKHDLLSPAHR